MASHRSAAKPTGNRQPGALAGLEPRHGQLSCFSSTSHRTRTMGTGPAFRGISHRPPTRQQRRRDLGVTTRGQSPSSGQQRSSLRSAHVCASHPRAPGRPSRPGGGSAGWASPVHQKVEVQFPVRVILGLQVQSLVGACCTLTSMLLSFSLPLPADLCLHAQKAQLPTGIADQRSTGASQAPTEKASRPMFCRHHTEQAAQKARSDAG